MHCHCGRLLTETTPTYIPHCRSNDSAWWGNYCLWAAMGANGNPSPKRIWKSTFRAPGCFMGCCLPNTVHPCLPCWWAPRGNTGRSVKPTVSGRLSEDSLAWTKRRCISAKIKLDSYWWKERPCEQVKRVLKAWFFIPEPCAHHASQTHHTGEEPSITSFWTWAVHFSFQSNWVVFVFCCCGGGGLLLFQIWPLFSRSNYSVGEITLTLLEEQISPPLSCGGKESHK